MSTNNGAAKVKVGIVDYLKMLWNGRSAVESVIQEGRLAADAYHKGGIRSLSFWLTALTSVGAVAAQVGGLIPNPYGAVALAISASGYAIARGLGKRSDPTASAKPTLATSEGLANIAAAVSQVVLAWQGIVPPETAAILAQVNAVSLAVSRALAATSDGSDAAQEVKAATSIPEGKELP